MAIQLLRRCIFVSSRAVCCLLLFAFGNRLHAQCPGLGSITFTVVAAPEPTLNFPASFCTGESATIAVNQPFSTYAWSTGSNASAITVSQGGTYTVTVTNTAGCEGTASATIAQLPGLNFTVSSQPYTCNGALTLVAGGGFPGYAWSNGGTGNTITVTTAGAYTVTATDANGCTDTQSFNAVIPPAPQVGISGNLVFCENSSSTLTATPGFANYQWSGGTPNSNTVTVSQAGSYTVTATDSFGCTDTETVSVASQPAPLPIVNQPNPICSGGTATLSVTNPVFQNYLWSNGGTGSSIAVSAAGTYTVTVTDANGCTGTAAATLAVNPSPVVVATQLPYQCNGLVELNATPGFTAYTWSNGGTTSIISVNLPGSYTVTVTDANGCTGTAAVTAVIPPDPQVSISGNAVICQGNNTILTATAGFAVYQWSTGQGSPSISVNSTGTYFVTVSDGFGCTATASFNVTEQPAPTPVISGPTQICAGGTAVFTAAGGNFTNYSWSNGGQTQVITVSTPGTYTLTVTDANGCTGTASVSLTDGNSLNIVISELPYLCNGEILLDAGAGFQSYSWSNGGSVQVVTVTTGGNYSVTVTDATGCTGTGTALVNIPAPPQASISGPAQICQGETAVLTATPGFQNYQWSNGQQNPGIAVTVPGTYTVTVSDANGCTASASTSLSVNPNPQPVISGITTICPNSATVLALGENYPLILWSGGQTTQQISVSAAGTFSVSVTDANGCTATAAVTVTEATSLSPQITALPYACDGQLTLDAGAGFTSYLWSEGSTGQSIVVSQNENYAVTVTDAGGCTGTAVFSANIPAQAEVVIAGSPAFCTGAGTTLTASAGFVNYIWSNGATVAGISVSQPGVYSVTATDADGCTSTDLLTVVENAPPQLQVLGNTVLCNGSTTVLSLGENFPLILWSGGQTTQQITVSAAGTFSVSVTDANGCTASAAVTVTEATSLSPQITALPYACDGQLTLDAGAGFTSYLWSEGSTVQSIVVSQNENYAVTVTDAGGCTGTAVFAANIPAQAEVVIAGSPTFCTGAGTTLTASAGFVNYLWSNGATVAGISVSQPGVYSVTATDANGCTATDVLTVVENAPPQVQILGSAAICNGNPTTLFLSATYAGYLWSNGSTAASTSIATAGLVSVTVTDAAGCTGSASIEVTEGSTLNPQIAVVSIDCSGLVAVGVGNAFDSYLWSNGGTNLVTLVSQTGTYSVTVTDANGCTGSASIFVQVPQQFSVSISGIPTFCPGGSTTLTATGGFQDYVWSNGAVGAQIAVSQPGDYAVTVSDVNGCTGTAQISVSEGGGVLPQIVGSTVLCVGGTTVLGIANAADFSQILWSNGSSASQITVSAAGTYAVTTTDGNGCTGTGEVVVAFGNVLAPEIVEGNYNCDGNLTLEAPQGFESYSWSTGAGTAAITVSQDGAYSLTVTDASGCTGTASIFVQVPEDVVVVVQTPPTPICPGNTAQLSVPPGFSSYQWSTGETANAIVIATPGVYAVTVTDQYGCTAADEYGFNFAEAPVFQIIGGLLDCETPEAVLELDFGSVAGAPTFLWSDGTTAPTLLTAQPGVFSLTVTDANGCTAAQEAEVLQQGSVSAFADTIEFVAGQVIPLSPPGADFLPVSISWSPSNILNCDNCPTVQARPVEEVLVSYTALSASGCVQTGTFFLFTKNRKRPSVYAPNAFSPDSPFNPAFTLFGNDRIANINYLRVFSRWGEKVFEAENLTPGDLQTGWDGTFRGQKMDAGVFVWVAEVLYDNGSAEVLKGDITLIR